MIGILVALKDEVKDILEDKMYGWEHKAGFEREAYMSGNGKLVMIITGVGKVYSAMGATMLCQYGVEEIISFGSSGHLGEMPIGTLISTNEFIEHDMDATGLGCPAGITPFTNVSSAKIHTIKPSFYYKIDLPTDIVISGDVFLSDPELRAKRIHQFGGKYTIDMESAAVAKVCNLFHMPFMTVRYITDNDGGDKAKIDWEHNLKDASSKFNNILKDLLF